MLDAWNRTEHYRDLAEECRRLATSTLSSRMRKRYLLMARDYILLADIERQGNAYHTRPRPQKTQTAPELPADARLADANNDSALALTGQRPS